MLIVSIAQVQTAYIWATFALNHRRSSTLNAPWLEHLHVTGKWAWSLFDKCNCFELKILIIFQAANLYGDIGCSCSRQTWFFFHSNAVVLCPNPRQEQRYVCSFIPLNLSMTFQPVNGWSHLMCISYPGQLQRPGIERELSLGCAFTYQPAAFGCRPAWQMGPGSRARSGAVGDN